MPGLSSETVGQSDPCKIRAALRRGGWTMQSGLEQGEFGAHWRLDRKLLQLKGNKCLKPC